MVQQEVNTIDPAIPQLHEWRLPDLEVKIQNQFVAHPEVMVIWDWEMRIVPDSQPDTAIATFQPSQPMQ